MACKFNITKALRDDVVKNQLPASTHAPNIQQYEFCLEEMDELVNSIFTTSGLNTEVYLGQMLHKSEAKEYLFRENIVTTDGQAAQTITR
jgi:hypothetical protein